MPPKAVFVPVPVRCAIVMPPVEFGLEAVHRTIVLALGLITPAAGPVKFVKRRFIPFLKMTAAVPLALADSFALGP
jgi:hypothetical protein